MATHIADLHIGDEDVTVQEVHCVHPTIQTQLIITPIRQNGSAAVDSRKNPVL